MASHKSDNCHGWLRRKSPRFNSWSRRWFVLNEKCIFVYQREDDKKSQDFIMLENQIVVEPPIDPNDPKVGYFDIVNEKLPAETISLCADTQEEKKVWMRSLKRALYASKGGALFSQSLEEILFWELQEGRQIPYIVDECVEYLYKYGLDAEGIFRLGGRMAVIKEIISRFERGEKINFEDENTDIHVVSSVLKTFLRDLPDSIIPCAFFQRFMNIAMRYMDSKEAITKEKCIDDLAAAMKEIPRDNYVILKYICRFLSKVADHEKSNKMNSMSIGTIFGPNVIRHIDAENPHLHLCTADLSQHLVHMMLQYFSKVFVKEYSDGGSISNNVPTADLLHMSCVINVPVPAPRKKFDLTKDLDGIRLESTSDSQSGVPSNGSISIFEDFFSAPNSPISEDAKDVFCEQEGDKSRNVTFRRTLHLSLKATKHSMENSENPKSCLGDPPVPPTRPKKLIRNRRLLDTHRPNITVSDRDQLSPGSDSCENVYDEETETGEHTKVLKCNTLPPDMSLSNPVFKKHTTGSPDEDVAPLAMPEIIDEELSNKQGRRDGKLGPRHEDLELQVSILKEEISSQRERYKRQVSALTSQLSEMQSKYEHRINTMEAECNSQKQELQNKLEKERRVCATSVEKTVRLKEELHKYQMQYGELPPF